MGTILFFKNLESGIQIFKNLGGSRPRLRFLRHCIQYKLNFTQYYKKLQSKKPTAKLMLYSF